jgi:ribosomal protein S6
MKVSYRIERLQNGNWTIVRLNIATLKTAEAEFIAMKSENALPLQIVKVTEEVVG